MPDAKIVTEAMRKDHLEVLPPEDDPPLRDQKAPKQITVHNPIYLPEDIENAYHSDEFNVNQLLQRGTDGTLQYSTFLVRLYPNKQGFHLRNSNFQIRYQITHGRGWILLDGHGYTFDSKGVTDEQRQKYQGIDQPTFVLVQKDQDCQILNNSGEDHVDFDFIFPGKLDIGRVIGEDKKHRRLK